MGLEERPQTAVPALLELPRGPFDETRKLPGEASGVSHEADEHTKGGERGVPGEEWRDVGHSARRSGRARGVGLAIAGACGHSGRTCAASRKHLSTLNGLRHMRTGSAIPCVNTLM